MLFGLLREFISGDKVSAIVSVNKIVTEPSSSKLLKSPLAALSFAEKRIGRDVPSVRNGS